MSNDDDREEFMQPFIDKVSTWDASVFPQAPEGWNVEDEIKRWKKEGTFDADVGVRKWWFLKEWETPIKEEIDEKLSDRGKEDALVSFLYPHRPKKKRRFRPADVYRVRSPGLWTSHPIVLLGPVSRPSYG